jgi:lysozyme
LLLAEKEKPQSVPADLSKLEARLKQAEGWRDKLYMDTTGNLTIGWGFNLARLVLPPGVDFRDVRIVPVTKLPRVLGDSWLTGLMLDVIEQLNFALPWYAALDDVRQRVLAEMAYNLGVPGLLQWPIFLSQVQRGEYRAAAENMKSTLWAHQVGSRARELAAMMAGKDPEP